MIQSATGFSNFVETCKETMFKKIYHHFLLNKNYHHLVQPRILDTSGGIKTSVHLCIFCSYKEAK
jgi:phosphomannomutase